MNTVSAFLAEIEAFLISRNMSATKFGILTVNDGHLVRKLRTGQRDIRASRIDAIREWMRGFSAAADHVKQPSAASDDFRSGYMIGKHWKDTEPVAPRRRPARRCAA